MEKCGVNRMKIMLDCSPKKIKEYTEKYDYEFWQLRTPLTGYALAGVPYALDNGCFTEFREKKWLSLIDEADEQRMTNKPIFCTMPDIVGDARRTWELFELYMGKSKGLPRALVLQDGVGNVDINWNWVNAVFVGGSDNFKISAECINACKTAKILNKWIHVGRVNTAARVRNWIGLADSIDGSGISMYDHMLEDVLRIIKNEDEQMGLLD